MSKKGKKMQYDEKYTEYNEITLQGLSLWLNLVNWLMRTVKPKKRHKLRMGFDPNTNSEYVALDVRSYEDLSQVISDLGMKPEDLPEMVTNARDIAGGFYRFDVRPLTDDEVLEIYKKSYK